jgi:hypothetical protein
MLLIWEVFSLKLDCSTNCACEEFLWASRSFGWEIVFYWNMEMSSEWNFGQIKPFYLYIFSYSLKFWGSSVGIAAGYGLDDRVSNPGGGWEIFSSPPRRDQLLCPLSLLSNGYWCSFLWGKAAGGWSWPLTSFQCRGQECVALYLHPNTSSWRGA